MGEHDSIRLVLVTAPNSEVGEKIAKTLVEKELAACVNILPDLRSIYRWEGEVQDDRELLLMIKTRDNLINDHLIPVVKKLHPYQVPEIISLPVEGGGQAYLDWILSETMDLEDETPAD
jgi:periplasmic divalent cation tolerance protein